MTRTNQKNADLRGLLTELTVNSDHFLRDDVKWTVVQDVFSHFSLVKSLYSITIMDTNVQEISGPALRDRAIQANANLGLAHAQHFLHYQRVIPDDLKNNCLLFTGTVFRKPKDGLFIVTLYWSSDGWFAELRRFDYFRWHGNYGNYNRLPVPIYK